MVENIESAVKIPSRPELELNLAGGLLATITQKDLKAFIERAQEAGFPNFCALPFRGLKKGGIGELVERGVSIVHIEDAWNPLSGKLYDRLIPALVAGTYGTFSRKILRKRSEIPLIEDSFFPSEETCSQVFGELMEAFPKAKFISHKASLGRVPKSRFLLEIHPGLEMKKEEIVDWAQEMGVSLVFDPSHLLQKAATISTPNQPTRLKNDWEGEFNFFANTGQIEVIDIQPSSKAGGSYRQIEKGARLQELAAAAKETASIKYLRVETRLPIKDQLPVISRRKDFPVLRQIAQTLRKV